MTVEGLMIVRPTKDTYARAGLSTGVGLERGAGAALEG
jgi:hypothetical protein